MVSGVVFNKFTPHNYLYIYHPPPYVPLSLMSENTHTIIFLHFHITHHNTRTYHTLHPLLRLPASFRAILRKDERLFLHFRHRTYTDIAHTENTQHTHTIITLHPLTQNPTTSCLLPSHYLKRQQTSQSVLIFYWSREMATNTQRPSLCCSLLPRITRSMLLRTRLKSLFWIQTVSVLCMLTICKVYESLHHYVMVKVRAGRGTG